MEGKTEAEVSKYSKKFWKNYTDLADAERIIKNIERGELRIKRQQDIMSALAAKLDRYKNPWQELRLQYGANKGKVYTGISQAGMTQIPASVGKYMATRRTPCRVLDGDTARSGCTTL